MNPIQSYRGGAQTAPPDVSVNSETSVAKNFRVFRVFRGSIQV
jgi:hypothetical protein